MTGNRAQRRAMQADAANLADKMASLVYDIDGGNLVPVTDSAALAALRRAFRLMLRAGGAPMAIPLSPAEADGFPQHKRRCLPGGRSWLAVGLDPDGRGSYALQSAWSEAGKVAQDAAREMALGRLPRLTGSRGFGPG